MAISKSCLEKIDKFIGCTIQPDNVIEQVGLISRDSLKEDETENPDIELVKREEIASLIPLEEDSLIEAFLSGFIKEARKLIEIDEYENVYTVYIKDDEWKLGERVFRYYMDGNLYIKSSQNNKSEDNLDEVKSCDGFQNMGGNNQ